MSVRRQKHQSTTERKSGLCEPRLRGSDGTCLPREVRRSQWRSWQYILVSVFIRVLYKWPLCDLSGVKVLWGDSLKWSLMFSEESWTLSWIAIKAGLPCSATRHWNALPMEPWSFLFMRTLRTGKAIICQDGRGSSSPKAKGHKWKTLVDLLILSVQSLVVFEFIIEVK